MKNIYFLVLFLNLNIVVWSQCTPANYSSVFAIPATSFPYNSVSASVTVSAATNVPTLGNVTYSCNGNNYATASPAWWINSSTHFITLTFSKPVSNFTMITNGTNTGEVFFFAANSGTVTLSNFCTIDWSTAGNSVTYNGTAASGSIITVNNPAGATQYTITHNGVGSGYRISLLDCIVLSALPVDVVKLEGYTQGANNILTWKVQSDINAKKYIVERAVSNTETFIPFSETQSTAGQDQFEVKDTQPFVQTKYRLKRLDQDGNTKIFGPVELENKDISATLVRKVYPNPAQQQFWIEVPVMNTEVCIQIQNVTGTTQFQDCQYIEQGKIFEISTQNWPSGVYLLNVSDTQTGKRHTQKLIVE